MYSKAVSKCGLVPVIALLAAAAMASSAQAVTFNPDNAPVSGTTEFPTLSYEETEIVCDIGTLDGSTGLNSDTVPDVALGFFGNCSVAGILDATLGCQGDASLIARTNDPPGGTGDFNLNEGFACDISTDICVVTFAGPQQGSFVLDEGNNELYVGAEFEATRDPEGSELCGPEEGRLIYSGVYDVTGMTIDP